MRAFEGWDKKVVNDWRGNFIALFRFQHPELFLVFQQYRKAYDANSWNTSDIGRVIKNFSSPLVAWTAYLVAYPHWVDSRGCGSECGLSTEGLCHLVDQFEATKTDPRSKLFAINITTKKIFGCYRGCIPMVYQVFTMSLEGKPLFIFCARRAIGAVESDLFAELRNG